MSAFIYKSISVLFFVLMSVCIKANRGFLFSPLLIIPLFLVIFYFNLKITSINNYKLHFFRGLVGIAAMSLFFISLRYVPLIEMQTISYSSVFFISILSIFFLGEKIGYRRVIAIIVGFIGVVIILKPDVNLFSNYSVLPLLASIFLSMAVIILKKILLTNNNILSVWTFTLFATLISLFFFNDDWIWPNNFDLVLLIASGILGFVAQLCLSKSFQLADASVLAPLDFTSVIWAFLIGYIIFGEFLSREVLLGGPLILLSVGYIFYRETVLRKKIVLGSNKQF